MFELLFFVNVFCLVGFFFYLACRCFTYNDDRDVRYNLRCLECIWLKDGGVSIDEVMSNLQGVDTSGFHLSMYTEGGE